MMRNSLALLAFFLFTGLANAQTIPGRWVGSIDIQGNELGVIVNITGEAGNYSGTLDIPMQGVKELPLMYVVNRNDSLLAAFNAGPNVGEFKGKMLNPDYIEGSYTQGGSSFPFELQKENVLETSTDPLGMGEELVIKNGDIEIAGTLVTPWGTNQPPIVIFLSGSGAQNRDSEILDFKPFAQMADYLKDHNIASFRFDDRGTGRSTGSFLNTTLDMLASDVNTVLSFLQDSVSTSFGDIILLGHSQGGIVAGKVASEKPAVDELILMASPSVSMKELLRFQVRQAYEKFDLPDDVIDAEINAREKLMDSIEKEEDIEEAREEYLAEYQKVLQALSDEQKAVIPEDTGAFADRQVNQLEAFYRTPQMQSLLFYDPAKDLETLNIPVLVLFGEKDIQVATSVNRNPVESALEQAGVESEIKTIKDANHLFQKAETGEASEYAILPKEFAEGFMETIAEWIQSN